MPREAPQPWYSAPLCRPRTLPTRGPPCFFISGAIDKLLLDEPFCSMSAQELSRLRLRVASLGLWHGCDLKDMQLRSLEFEDKPFRGGQVGRD